MLRFCSGVQQTSADAHVVLAAGPGSRGGKRMPRVRSRGSSKRRFARRRSRSRPPIKCCLETCVPCREYALITFQQSLIHINIFFSVFKQFLLQYASMFLQKRNKVQYSNSLFKFMTTLADPQPACYQEEDSLEPVHLLLSRQRKKICFPTPGGRCHQANKL